MSTYTPTKTKQEKPACPENSVEFTGYCHPRSKGMSEEEKKENPLSWVAEITGIDSTSEAEPRFKLQFIDPDWTEWHGKFNKDNPKPTATTKTWFLKEGVIYCVCHLADKNAEPVYSNVRIESGKAIEMEDEQIHSIFRDNT